MVESLSYDPHGKRREVDWQAAVLPIDPLETPRGFTGHEHLDKLALIHMNGRVYDPALGRFLSADPIVQFPASTQGLNRYAYAANNPLGFTDPSGLGIFSTIAGFLKNVFVDTPAKILRKVTSNPIGLVAVLIGASALCGPPCAAGASAAITAAHGGGPGDILKSAAITGATAYAFSAIGDVFPDGIEFGSAAHAAKIVAHGAVGGVSNEFSGGSFLAGFAAGALTQAVAPAISSLRLDTVDGRIGRTVIAAVAGGAGAKLGGGKFVNGAVTGAFSRFYNDELHLTFTVRVSGAVRRIVNKVLGTNNIGQEITFGVGISFPRMVGKTVIGDPNDLDTAFFVRGLAGGEDIGLGEGGFAAGVGPGNMLDMEGRGTTFFGMVRNFGGAVNLDADNNFQSFEGRIAARGLDGGFGGTLTRVFSLRRFLSGSR